MYIHREWSMASVETLRVKPIREFVMKYLRSDMESIDPFARNCLLAKYRNDINMKTKADYHMDVKDFLNLMIAREIKIDFALWDPPYSIQSAKRCYRNSKAEWTVKDQKRWGYWSEERDLLDRLIRPRGVVISLGWSSNAMGQTRGYEIIEIMLVAHGGARNDTICVVERKIS